MSPVLANNLINNSLFCAIQAAEIRFLASDILASVSYKTFHIVVLNVDTGLLYSKHFDNFIGQSLNIHSPLMANSGQDTLVLAIIKI